MIVEIETLPTPIVEVVNADTYHVFAEVQPPMVVEVMGLFPTNIISQDVDGGTIF